MKSNNSSNNTKRESSQQAIQLVLLALGFCLFVRMAILSPPVAHVPVDDIVVRTRLEQAELDSSSSLSSSSTTKAMTTTKGGDGICSHFPQHFTAASLWKEHLDTIWEASHNPTKPEYSNSTVLKDILYNILSPSRLRQGLRTRPSNQHGTVSRVVEILETKLRNPAGSAPPLKIAVLGGSVTAGRGCWPGFRGLVNRECAWPRRLEYLVNQAFGLELIQVYNMAVGGTSTAQGNVFVKYWMYPDEIRQTGPDIIINSYSTNDSLPPWGQTEGVTETVLKRTRQNLQAFVRYALLSRPCAPPPPLVIHVDDYLGHQNPNSLLGELSYNTGMVQVANWYGTMAVSYPDTVRDIVYQNTAETTFSANWKNHHSPGDLKIEVHFGFEGHTAISWVVAYSLLEVLSNYCDEQGNVAAAVTQQLDKKEKDWRLVIPPTLDDTIRLQDVSQRWQEGPQDEGYDPNLDCSTDATASSNQNPCVLTWIAAPTGIFNAGALRKFMQQHTIQNDGWGTLDDMKNYGWANKLGWEPKKAGASFTMQLSDIPKDIRVVTVMYMKSYGDKWANSTARFTVQDLVGAFNQTLTTQDLLGYHDSKTSISYTERIVLPQSIPKGGTMNLRVDLIGGTTFKISAMMFCSW